MSSPSLFAMIHTLDQWHRVSHSETTVAREDEQHGYVQLAWEMEEPGDQDLASPDSSAGMAFDSWCRLYRAVPECGQVEKLLWAAKRPDYQPEPVAIFAAAAASEIGDFTPAEESSGQPLQQPVDVVVDGDGKLFIAEQGSRSVLLYDLVEQRLLERFVFPFAPIALATDGDNVWVILAAGSGVYARLRSRATPELLNLPADISQPRAIAYTANGLYVIDGEGESARVIPINSPADAFAVAHAGALLFVAPDILVVARRSGESLLRFQIHAGNQFELPYLTARHYDGRGLVLTPEGEVAFWSTQGRLMRATLARVRYQPRGRVVTYRLDSGAFQTQWGRLFVDACLPSGTQLVARCLCADELPEVGAKLPRNPPSNAISITIARPDLSPPMPPQALLEQPLPEHLFYRRGDSELAWQSSTQADHFQTYEAPVMAPAGRYLWVELELVGSARSTPKIRNLRVEYPAHGLLQRLPQVYSRETQVADFLRRYLAISEGDLRALELRSNLRHLLLDPRATPAAMLPWLANFLGLVLDQRWPEPVRRELIANANWLFRFRGTVAGLKRFLAIYLGCEVTIIEHFKMRGLGGALLGQDDALNSNSVLGSGFRIGGQIGREETQSSNEIDLNTSIQTHAHRFSVIVPLALNAQQQDVVALILREHRPAHTLYDVCTVDSGIRVGMGLHLGLTSMVGNTSGFGRYQVGGSILGRRDTLGVAPPGTQVGSGQLSNDTRVG